MTSFPQKEVQFKHTFMNPPKVNIKFYNFNDDQVDVQVEPINITRNSCIIPAFESDETIDYAECNTCGFCLKKDLRQIYFVGPQYNDFVITDINDFNSIRPGMLHHSSGLIVDNKLYLNKQLQPQVINPVSISNTHLVADGKLYYVNRSDNSLTQIGTDNTWYLCGSNIAANSSGLYGLSNETIAIQIDSSIKDWKALSSYAAGSLSHRFQLRSNGSLYVHYNDTFSLVGNYNITQISHGERQGNVYPIFVSPTNGIYTSLQKSDCALLMSGSGWTHCAGSIYRAKAMGIREGKLYGYNSASDASFPTSTSGYSFSLIDDSGEWTDIYGYYASYLGIGIRDGVLCTIDKNNKITPYPSYGTCIKLIKTGTFYVVALFTN